MTSPPDDIVMTPPPNNIFTSGDTPFNDYTFPPPPQEIEITTPVTGLMELPEERIESFTFEKFQDGFTWEVDEDGFLYKQWDEDRLGTNPEPKPEYPQVTENYTIVQNEDDTYTFATHSPYISDGYDWKPYILGQDESVVQIQIAGGTVVFDKVAGAVTIFNEYETVIDSDSYTVRTALIDSDVWDNLDVNNADVETTVVEDGDKVTVSFIRENDEGKFTTEYVIYSGKVKTTVYFTNYIYENNKFAFTQTLDLPGNIISVNDMQDIDLNDYVGVSFDRATLEENIDLVLEIKDMYYSSGLGFDNLWSVNVTTPTKVSLDYANVEQTQTEIGDTVELDPTYTLNKATAMSPAQSTSSYGNSQGDSLGCGGRIASGEQGYNMGWYLRNYVGSWYTWNGCRTAMVGFDLSGIPDSAIISDTKLVYDIIYNNNAGTFDLNQMTQSGQDGWGMWNNDASQPVGTNPYSVYNTTNWDKTWEMYLDANNLGTQPNGAGSQYAYNVSSAVGADIVTDLGAAGNADVMAQLKASTSVNGVADWYGIGMPYTAMKNGATAATNWTSQSVQTSYTQDMDFDNVKLLVSFYSPPSIPTNLVLTPNGANVDLSWSESEIYTDYIVSSIAKNNYGTGIALPATWSLWQGGASPTTPTMGVGGVLGTAFDFNGSTDIIGENHVTGFPNSGVSPTQGSISVWIKPEATGASAGNPIGGTGLGSYWIQNGQWSSYYPLNSFNIGSIYSNANAYNMNEWNHLVATVDSSGGGTLVGTCPFSGGCANIWTIYMNGSPVQMYSYPSGTGGGVAINGSPQSASNLLANLQLGGQYHPNPQFKYPFDGKIDEFSSWDRVLSQSEVTTLYNSGSGNTPDVIPSIDVSASSDSNMHYQLANATGTTCNETYVSKTSSYTLVSGGNQGSLYCSYLLFGYDVSDIPDNATITNVVLEHSADGNAGGAFNKVITPIIKNPSTATDQEMATDIGDGTPYATVTTAMPYYDNIVDLGTGADSNLTALLSSGDNTWYFGVKPETRPSNNTNNNYAMFAQGESKLSISYTADGISNNLITYFPLDNTSAPLPNMAVETLPSNNNITYYINRDGTGLTNTTNLSVTDNTVSFNTSYVYSLQAYNNAGGGSKLNESPYEVSSDAVSTDGTNNGATTGAGGIIGNGWDFDGVNDYVDLPQMSLNNSDGHTWSVWANLGGGSGGTASGGMEIIGKANYVNLLISDESTSGQTWASVYYAGALSGTGYDTMNSGWHHYAGVTDCNGYTQWQCPVTIYMDGTSIGTGTSGMYSPADYVIGARQGSGAQSLFVNGLIDEFSAFDRALTSSEVTSLYANGYPEPVNMQSWIAGSDLTHYYNFEQTGNTLTNMAVTEDPSSYAVTLTVEPPTNLTATLNVPNVDLSWTGGAGATGYKIETSTNGTNWTNVTANTGSTATTYQHTAPVQNTTNHYKVTTLIGSDVSTANTGSSTITPVNYRTYTATANASTCDTGTIAADQMHEIGMPAQNGGNRYCLVTSMEYDISAIPDVGTITSAVIEESHVIWTAGFAPSCDYKSNMSYQPSTSTTQEKWDSVIAGTVYANDPACISGYTSNSVYDVPLGSQAVTDIQSQLPGDWFGVNWAIDNFPSLANAGTVGTPASIYNGSSLLKLEYLAPASITVGGAPDSPTGLTATFNTTTTDIDLSWTAPSQTNGSAITGYKIEVSTDGTNFTDLNANTGSITTTHIDTNPTMGSLNYYKVSAINAYGNSLTSNVDNDMAGIAPDAPTITSTSTDSANSAPLEITVNWQAPTNTGTAGITNYEVYRDSTLITTVGNVTTYVDTVPTGGGSFVYSLKSVTPHGTSVLSATASHTTPTPPPAPTSSPTMSIANSNSNPFDVTVSFALPSSGGSAITSFEIFRSNDNVTFTSVGVTSTLLFYDTVPSAGTWYYTFTSTNLVGSSGQSPSGNITTATVPTSDSSVTLAIADPNSTPLDVTVSFTAPTSNGGSNITGYNLSSSPDDSVYTQVATNVTADQTITVANDGTWYFKSQAINPVGTSAFGSSVSITTASVPVSDSSVTLSIDNPNPNPLDVTVSFVAPSDNGGSNITGYNLSSSPDDSVYTQVATNVTSDQTITVANAGTWYFKSQSINPVGTSAFGSSVSITTATVPVAITDLSISGVTDTASTLTWTEPSNGGSNNIDYAVFRDGVLVGTVTTLGFTDTGLTTQTSYVYTVFSRNNVGTSLVSNSVTQVTQGVPAAVSSFSAVTASLESITLSWTAPNDFGSAITGYLIERESPIGNGFTTLTTTGPNVNYSDPGLTSVTEYNYRISAINSYGNSSTTMSSAITLPAPPTDVLVTPSSSTSELVITWNTPTLTTGITGYQVVREDGIGAGFTPISVASGTTFTDTGLTSNIYYNYKLKSVSSQGTSEFSNTYSQTTFHVPDPVTTLSATAGDLIDAGLTWTAPTIPYASVTGYEIFQGEVAGTPTVLIDTLGPAAFTYTATDLDPTITYYWLVAPVTIHGTNTTGNVASATATSEIIIGSIVVDDTINPVQVPIIFDKVRTGDVMELTVTYATGTDLNCMFENKFARTITNHDNLAETYVSSAKSSHTFTFNDSAKEIINVHCYDKTTNPDGTLLNDQNDGQEQINFATQPIVTQVNEFQKGAFGIQSGFGAFDLMTLFVVLVSMVGFNRTSPTVGVGIMVAFIGAMGYFGIIETPTIVMGAIAVVVVLSLGQVRKNR